MLLAADFCGSWGWPLPAEKAWQGYKILSLGTYIPIGGSGEHKEYK
jgi:hypothetical protein